MTEKRELRKLNRHDLLELLVRQEQQNEQYLDNIKRLSEQQQGTHTRIGPAER